MFDPFKNFEEAGYLNNVLKEKNGTAVRAIEHDLFRTNLPEALSYLSQVEIIGYGDFLAVHKILFGAFYPWAGMDRATVAPDIAISKGDVMFAHPRDAEKAVSHALEIGQDPTQMRQEPGKVMGLFAYGHPFLDGNGRTMLIVHSELCCRAGFSIDWSRTAKSEYLAALSEEIREANGSLDAYLHDFASERIERDAWERTVASLPGLDGARRDVVEGEFSDEAVAEKYRAFDERRGYRIEDKGRS